MGIIYPLGCVFTFLALPKQNTELLRLMYAEE